MAPVSQNVHSKYLRIAAIQGAKLEDLKVLRRSPDLLNNVKIVEGQLQLFVLPYMGVAAILVKRPKQSNE